MFAMSVANRAREVWEDERAALSEERKLVYKWFVFSGYLPGPCLLVAFRKPNVQIRESERLFFMQVSALVSELMATLISKIHHEVLAYNLSTNLASAWILSDEYIRLNDEALLPTRQKKEIFSDIHLKLPRLNS